MSTTNRHLAPALPRPRAARPAVTRNQHTVRLGRAVVWLTLVLGAALMMAPFLFLVSSSLKEPSKIWLYPPQFIPDPVRWRNYTEALTALPFGLYFRNTLVITLFTMVGVLLTSSLAAYAFARLRFPGRDVIFIVLLSALMLPYTVVLIPSYILYKYLGWLDTYLPLIVPSYFGGGIFNIFLLRQFFRTIPADLTDAARIDGASELGIYARIILPLSGPALTTIGIFTFLHSWNDFLGPLIYLSSHDKYTVALGLAQFRGLYATQWQYLMAASTVIILPAILLFLLGQRFFVRGIALTGLKG